MFYLRKKRKHIYRSIQGLRASWERQAEMWGGSAAIFMQIPDGLCKIATQCVIADHAVEDIVLGRGF